MTPGRQALRDALAALPDRVAAAVAMLARSPEAEPAPGAWSAREVALHLAAVEVEVWRPRLDALAAAAFPEGPWVEPGTWTGAGGGAFPPPLGIFRRERATTVARLEALDDAGWDRRGRHAVYGVLDVAGLLRIALDHD